MECCSNQFQSLPNEILLHIAKFCDNLQLFELHLCCRRLYYLLKSAGLLGKFDLYENFTFKLNNQNKRILTRWKGIIYEHKYDPYGEPVKLSSDIVQLSSEYWEHQLIALAATQRFNLRLIGTLWVAVEDQHIDSLLLRAIGKFPQSRKRAKRIKEWKGHIQGKPYVHPAVYHGRTDIWTYTFTRCTFDMAKLELRMLGFPCGGIDFEDCPSESGTLITPELLRGKHIARFVRLVGNENLLYDVCHINDSHIDFMSHYRHYMLLFNGVTSCTLARIAKYMQERWDSPRIARSSSKVHFGYVCCEFSKLSSIVSEDFLTFFKYPQPNVNVGDTTEAPEGLFKGYPIIVLDNVRVGVKIVDCCCRDKLLFSVCSHSEP